MKKNNNHQEQGRFCFYLVFYSPSYLTFYVNYDKILNITQRKGDFLKEYKEIIRIGLVLLWGIGLLLTLVQVQKNPNIIILILTIVFIGMIGTKEPIIVLAVAEWCIFFGYASFLGYFLMKQSQDVMKLLIATVIFIFVVMIRRVKNFSNYVF